MRQKLGQHFLTDVTVIDDMVASLKFDTDVLVEVGPGKGVLTDELLKTGKPVVAVEWDELMVAHLLNRFAASENFYLVHADIRKFDLITYIKGLFPSFKTYTIAANLPYYLTSYFVRQAFEYQVLPSQMSLLVQKEVAERITAECHSSDRSMLSVLSQTYSKPRIVRQVSRFAFNPPPEVESAVVLFDEIANPFKTREVERHYFRVVKAGFASKRKTIVNAIGAGLHLERGAAEELLNKAGIETSVRAEDISVEQWVALDTVAKVSVN
jgi:16S rRNA (adenine1518-N6/adenine1519-N6)-dimethyltransferase